MQNFAKIIVPDLKVQSISIIDSYQELIQDYDNNYHQLLNQRKYTFGKFYQKGGQTTEKESANVEHCDKFYHFLQLLGSLRLKSEYDNLNIFQHVYCILELVTENCPSNFFHRGIY